MPRGHAACQTLACTNRILRTEVMALAPGRSVQRFQIRPITPDGKLVVFDEPWSSRLAWLQLLWLADNEDAIRARFPGGGPEKSRAFKEFRAFLYQAKAYYVAAESTEGVASALPFYYSFLNLAKAELLLSRGTSFLNSSLGHGIRAPNPARGVQLDRLRIINGVFRWLYTDRLGHGPPEDEIPVARVLRNVRPLGYEFDHSGIGAAATYGGWHAIAIDEQRMWSIIALDTRLAGSSSNPTNQAILRNFTPVQIQRNWKEIFGVSLRSVVQAQAVLESKYQQPVERGVEGAALSAHFEKQSAAAWKALAGIADFSHLPTHDFIVCPHLYESRPWPMPASLAAYATLFYVSSLVRYAPSLLDPRDNPRQAWLLSAAPAEVAPLLLHAAVNRIDATHSFYWAPEAMRA